MGRRRVSEEHKRERKRAENKRREMTRIHLGTCFPQWAELKSLRKDNNVALVDHLLKVHEHYCKSCRELRTGTISRVEDLQSSYDSRQDEVSSRESRSSRNVKVVNQNGQVYVTLDRDMQKSGAGNGHHHHQQQQQQHQQQIPVLVSSQPNVNSYQQNVMVHSPFVNKPQTRISDQICQQSAFMNQIPSGYSIGEALPKHMNNEIGRQMLSNNSQDSSGVQDPVSIQMAQRTSLTRNNPQGHPDKGGVIHGNVHHVGRESGTGKHEVHVEKQLEVKEEPVDDFVVIINPDDDEEDEEEYDGETTDTCEESDLTSEPHDKEFDLFEVKEEPIDDYPDDAGHPQEGSAECHRGLKTDATIPNGTQHQSGKSRMCLPDGNSFSSSDINTTSPSLQEAIIEVVTCYRYGDLVNRHLPSSSNNVKDRQLMSCDNFLKQIPQTGTHVTHTKQGQMGIEVQEILKKRNHVLEEQDQTQKKTKHNV
ncbi:uncharacterized protein [Haliotis asinina]|uniref:uncharacterized protein isoform X2 n=1 Tax=Haliotis asinina TaxID=109174 RepID=UPI00353226AD